MKKWFQIGLILSLISIPHKALSQSDQHIREGVQTIAQQLENQLRPSNKKNVAILPFWTSVGKQTDFSAFILDELNLFWQNNKRFNVLDPNVVKQASESFGWTLEKAQQYST